MGQLLLLDCNSVILTVCSAYALSFSFLVRLFYFILRFNI